MSDYRTLLVSLVFITTVACTTTTAARDCVPSHFAAGSGMPDGQATTSDDIEVWGLFIPAEQRSIDDEPIVIDLVDTWGPGDAEPRRGTKIVWRATGDGPFTVTAIGPDDSPVEPFFQQEHPGSTWDRPGQEWGTGWELPESGCWTFVIERGKDTAELSIEVRA